MKLPRLLILGALLLCGFTGAARAGNVSPNPLPDLFSVGIGAFDVNQNTPRLRTMDFRLEYRWGTSLLYDVNSGLASWDNWFQLHPFAGFQFTPRGQLYSFGGFVFDILLGKHVVLSPNVTLGHYYRGNGKELGSGLEFRSTLEGGWRFDNDIRLTAFFGHSSNAGIGHINPGAEEAGIYLHIPLRSIF